MTPATLPFFKMNGIGNSILVVDARGTHAAVTPSLARQAARLPRLGFDQLMAIETPRSAGTDAYLSIFNADGTEAGACGNGTRCVAWAMMQQDAKRSVVVETAGGSLVCERVGSLRFSVDMGPPTFRWHDIPLATPVQDILDVRLQPEAGLPEEYRRCAVVGMGNPHAVFFLPDAAGAAVERIGPIVEHHPMFPQRANVSFAQVVDRAAIRLRVWERSAGATLACGSAACATAVAGMRLGLVDRHVRVSLPGGDLEIDWRAADNHVLMTGDVALEHAGTLPVELSSFAA